MFPNTDDMFSALLNNQVDAVLFSAPTLHYFAARGWSGKVKLVGPEFRKLDIGFATPINSPHRREINAALLSLRDDGSYDRIYAKWFGSD
ncbi:MAG TPA: transporter substrate-binding domain-containing protein [Acetobacteraceae bacterium]|nr:transporter substrate-binding domain-containing protein [Acetobacteraceae bacterium]